MATKTTLDEVPSASSGCWCCGDATVRGSLLRLEHRPEVGVCFRCVKTLSRRKRQIQRRTRHAPAGPLHRRVAYRLGFGSC
jgi:hypothetical protein